MRSIFRVLAITALILPLVALALPAQSHAQGVERVLIRFTPGQKANVVQAVERQGGQIHFEFDELNTIAVTLPVQAIEGLRHNPNVVTIEEDAPRYLTDQVIPYGIDTVEARAVWDANGDGVVDHNAATGAGRMICVVDSGVYVDHEDFSGVNFVGGYPNGWNTDACGHGTHVTGIIAAMNNTTGVVGVTPGTVSLYIVKVFGDSCSWTYSSTLVDAANRCRDAGADIISMSLTGSYSSSFEEEAFQNLYDQGILSVASAGNAGTTAYGFPASYDSVISVAALYPDNVVAGFSQKNDQVELAAPGISIYSTANSGGYTYKNGTSMATPHVSAAAAIVWSTNLTKTNVEVRNALQQSALDLGQPGRDNASGYGLVQTQCACYTLTPMPTVVEMARFDAFVQDAGILLEWETTSEINNLGYNLYRAESPDGPRAQLNSEMIPMQWPGSSTGAIYQFLDESVTLGSTYYYWLEAVDVSGRTTEYGPAVIKTISEKSLPARPRPAPIPAPPRAKTGSRSLSEPLPDE